MPGVRCGRRGCGRRRDRARGRRRRHVPRGRRRGAWPRRRVGDVEIVDTVCTGRCRAAPRPSFALDGRRVAGPEGATTVCHHPWRVIVSGIVTGPLTPVAAVGRGRRWRDGPGGDRIHAPERIAAVGITYLAATARTWCPLRAASAPVDPVGGTERPLRGSAQSRIGGAVGLAAGRQIAGASRVVGVDGRGWTSRGLVGGFRKVFRSVSQVCRDSGRYAELEPRSEPGRRTPGKIL